MSLTTDPIGTLRVWWIPQVPMNPFHVPVKSIQEAALILRTLERYDAFQYDNNIKPDYSNIGGLEIVEELDGQKEYVEWYDEQTGDNIDEYMSTMKFN